MSNRDEFPDRIRRPSCSCGLALFLWWMPEAHCWPKRGVLDAITVIGIAAHICGAAPGRGSRRFIASMSPDERAGIDNAIWLCADHATLIDRDEVTYTAEKLRAVKREHETACARAVRTGSSPDLGAGLLAIGPRHSLHRRHLACHGKLAGRYALRHFVIATCTS